MGSSKLESKIIHSVNSDAKAKISEKITFTESKESKKRLQMKNGGCICVYQGHFSKSFSLQNKKKHTGNEKYV